MFCYTQCFHYTMYPFSFTQSITTFLINYLFFYPKFSQLLENERGFPAKWL